MTGARKGAWARIARGIGIVLASAMVLAAAAGCAQAPQPQQPTAAKPAEAPSLVGMWSAPALKGTPASLSELTFESGGTFRYAGHNALGVPVTFTGRYQTETSAGQSTVTLVFNDFPSQPEKWPYRIDGDSLYLTQPSNSGTPGTTVLHRSAQQ